MGRLLIMAIVGVTVSLGACKPSAQQTLYVYAASSTGPAVDELALEFETETGISVKVNQASSSTLARQISKGAPCDVFLSANKQWMAYLESARPDSLETSPLLRNSLALVTPRSEAIRVDATRSLGQYMEQVQGRIAVGDPEHVPVGIYAKQALKQLGCYQAVETRLVFMPSAMATLRLVERNEVLLGIVYLSDAKKSTQCHILYTVPNASHEPIIYPLSLVNPSSSAARKFYWFLQAKEALAVYRNYGFQTTPTGLHEAVASP